MPLTKGMSSDTFVKNMKEMINKYKLTGKIGKSKPSSLKKAKKQAMAIAYKVKRGK